MRKWIAVALIGLSGCQTVPTTKYEASPNVSHSNLSNFVGTWSFANDGARFDIRQGTDGRYFGYVDGLEGRRGQIVWGSDAGGWLYAFVDFEMDGRLSNSQLFSDILFICLTKDGQELLCNDEPARRESTSALIMRELAPDVRSAPPSWTPHENFHDYYASSRAEAQARHDAVWEARWEAQAETRRAEERAERRARADVQPNSASGNRGGSCWNQVQSDVTSSMQLRVAGARGLCPSAELSVELYSELLNGARRCQAGSGVIAEVEAALAQSQAAQRNSCR